VEVVELSDWLVDRALYEFLKCRGYISVWMKIEVDL
jgi:hypothetical protein